MRATMIAFMLFIGACLNTRSFEATAPDGEDTPTSAHEDPDDRGSASAGASEVSDAIPDPEEVPPADASASPDDADELTDGAAEESAPDPAAPAAEDAPPAIEATDDVGVVEDDISDSDPCGSCPSECACTGDGICDCSAVPETCDGVDNNRSGSVDEGLTRPCATACGDGTETCSDGVWVGCDALPELPEACDGYDNDCDGNPDNGCACVVGTFAECGTTVGECDIGIRWCSPTGWDPVCDGAITRVEETCNDRDDDCDGSTDEGCSCDFGATEPCGTDVGACVQGMRTCIAAGWSACADGIEPANEICDGVDNDCDGSTDEGFNVGSQCHAPGECRTVSGVLECDGSDALRMTTVCSTGPGGSHDASTAERCDGDDNDCDGATDDGFDLGVWCTAGLGMCGRGGEKVCRIDGTGTTCNASAGARLRSYEKYCDGVDEDCDGDTDEGMAQSCSTRCGSGMETCSAGAWVGCTAPSVPAEVCDGVDNNCDGAADEVCVCRVGTFQHCGTDTGACAYGERACVVTEGVASWSACAGGIGPTDEICDGVDNDCDGNTDEGFSIGQSCNPPGDVCTSGNIECSRNDATHLTTMCNTAPGGSRDMSNVERCDWRDNDCDGSTDEDFGDLRAPCTEGLGVCGRNGERVCRSDGAGTKCNASAGSRTQSSEYSCDGLDNDCDGSTDEGITRACSTRCGSGMETCSAGTWVGCTAPSVPVEVCDGVDNNCDGQRDEVCPCVVGTFQPCGIDTGECQKGTQECVRSEAGSSEWEDCTGATTATIEICNGLDDDCDGTVDDGFGVGQSCNPPGAVCTSGTMECDRRDATHLTTVCSTGPGGSRDMSSAERCDSYDNDCDGGTDEDFGLGVSCTVGIGSCERSGATTCSADAWSTRCSVSPGTPRTETCDGLDNDCDGIADNGLGDACCLPANTRPCGTDTGECIAGTQTCGSDRRWGTCSGISAITERCDTRDNDCDGGTDEDFPTLGEPCTGWCASGTITCTTTGSTRCSGNDPDAEGGCDLHPTCGNDVAEADEECDGADVRAQTCGDLGPAPEDGVLMCADDCTFDKTTCAFASVTLDTEGDGSEEPIWSGVCADASMCGVVATGVRKTVWVKPWVALERDGTPSVSDADIASLVAMLNRELGGQSNTTFASLPIGTLPSQFLKICSMDDPSCPFGYVDDATMFASAYESDALNVYLVSAAFMPGIGDVGGYSSLPCFDGSGPIMVGSSEQTFLQEVGHCFGIEHTFEDALCDTPPDPGPCWWNQRQGRNGPCCDKTWDDGVTCVLQCTPPFNPAMSPMDYYGCSGATTFTIEQGAQARCVLDRYLTFLDTDGTPPCTPDPEICDTVDQDCDGDIAEGPCDLPNATTSACVSGVCRIGACATGYGDCNGQPGDGCEMSLRTMSNCGVCNVSCRAPDHASASCTTGSCEFSCATGYRDCDGDPWNGCETVGPCGGCPECQTWNGTACIAIINGSGCTSDGNACTTDACASGSCVHAQVSCTTPPAPMCVDSRTLRTSTSSGTCGGGSCSYPSYDTTCAYGCAGGACASDPCAGISCNDGSSCTTDVCVSGLCVYTTIANDCGSRVCGSSPSGCFGCGSCPAGQACSSGSCVTACTCSPGATESRGCEDPSPYISYCVFEEERTCTGACTWGSWGSCTADRWYDQYGVDIGKWCDDTCITLTSCSGGTCTGYFSAENGGTFRSTYAYWRVVGDDGTSLAEPFACVSLNGLTRVAFSFPASRLHLTASSTYRGVSGTIWGGDDCGTNPPYTTDTTWVERCY